ncbi:MAG: 2-C-methyl-D-erythritol 2,4-cyclodiphosphate synthase [Selenomonadaceae bacterium]|nr:2-C-methyl-D-erythritol 2,4-cyclodiphosphate synthase [Selenomonadaceae bacterium]
MVTAIFPAAGASRRMGGGTNKIFLELGGEPILIRTLKTFSQSPRINFLIVIVSENDVYAVENLLSTADDLKPYKIVVGGSERQYSIANGLKFLPDDAEIVLVHDAARPLVSLKVIEDVIDAAEKFGGAIAAVPEKNTIKFIDGENFVTYTPPRSKLVEVQTPQGFRRELLLNAYKQAEADKFLGTDDSSLVERVGDKIKVVTSDYRNIKITTPEDLKIAESLVNPIIPSTSSLFPKIGMGYDVHKLVAHRKLILGNVEIPHELGLEGHSDADVLIHAIIDAILGAAALGDIGQHFPDTDERYKGIDSGELLKKVCALINLHGYKIGNVDATIVAQKPKLAPHILKIRARLAEILQVDSNLISVKATTTEGLGFTGQCQGISAYAVVLLER